MANADSVPILTSERSTSSGTMPASTATMHPVVTVVSSGVRVLAFTLATTGGNMRSRAIT